MPLYDYVCEKCGRDYEIFVPLKHLNEEIACPNCDTILRRLLSSTKVIKVN